MDPFDETPKSRTPNSSEVQELRYRISQLENLVVQNSLLSSTSSSLPSNSTLLHTPQGIGQRVDELERLLASSEHENEFLRNQLDILRVEKNKEQVQLLEKLMLKDTENKDLEHENKLLKLKLEKGEKKLANIQDYINNLPSHEELEEARSQMQKAQEEKELLEGKATRMLEVMDSLQKEKLNLENALRDAEHKIEELKPLEEAQQTFLKEGELSPLEFVNDKDAIKDYITLQKAQLIRSGKIITSLRDRIRKLESDKVENAVKLNNLESEIQSLKEALVASQIKTDDLLEKVRGLEQDKASLGSELLTLEREFVQQNSNVKERDDHIHSLIQLVTEIDLSVKDVESLVDVGKSLAAGEEPSVSSLLGISEEDLGIHFNSSSVQSPSILNKISLDVANSCSEFNPHDPEWTLERLLKIRSVRKHLRDLRNIASDLYTDMLESRAEGCKVQ